MDCSIFSHSWVSVFPVITSGDPVSWWAVPHGVLFVFSRSCFSVAVTCTLACTLKNFSPSLLLNPSFWSDPKVLFLQPVESQIEGLSPSPQDHDLSRCKHQTPSTESLQLIPMSIQAHLSTSCSSLL